MQLENQLESLMQNQQENQLENQQTQGEHLNINNKGWELNLRPCCEVLALTTVPLSHPKSALHFDWIFTPLMWASALCDVTKESSVTSCAFQLPFESNVLLLVPLQSFLRGRHKATAGCLLLDTGGRRTSQTNEISIHLHPSCGPADEGGLPA